MRKDHERTGKAACKAFARVLWLPTCKLWWRADRGRSPGIGERLSILALEVFHNLKGELDVMVHYCPSQPSQFLKGAPHVLAFTQTTKKKKKKQQPATNVPAILQRRRPHRARGNGYELWREPHLRLRMFNMIDG